VLKNILVWGLLLFMIGCSPGRPFTLSDGVSIIQRKEWGATKPVLPMRKHGIHRITIHHTAVKQNVNRSLEDKLKGLQKFSMQRSPLSDGRIKEPWADIPYHFYIAADGRIGEARELQYVGDSNTPYDPTGHALIVLEGNFNEEKPTVQQINSLNRLVLALAKKYKVAAELVSGHKDHAKTGCPGNNLYELIPRLKKEVAAQKKGQ
jgi:hypothetical protein